MLSFNLEDCILNLLSSEMQTVIYSNKHCSPAFVQPRIAQFSGAESFAVHGSRQAVNSSRWKFSSNLYFCCKAELDKLQGDHLMNLAVDSRKLASEKEEAKATLISFLKSLGLSKAEASQTAKKSSLFIMHLVNMLQLSYRTIYLTGRELTTIEIRSALLPYFEGLAIKYGEGLNDFLLYFPNTPSKQEYAREDVNKSRSTSKNIMKPTKLESGGHLHPSLAYLLTFGLDLEQAKVLVGKFPSIVSYSIDRKLRPMVELLLELGIPQSDIHKIILKRPQLFGLSLNDNLKSTIAYLESLGVEKLYWARILVKFPALLTYNKRKIKGVFDFMLGIGIPSSDIGKILTRFPHIVSYSVEENLRPTAAYFKSIGIDPGHLAFRSPQTFGLSVDANIKPITGFFLDAGFSIKDISTMVTRFGTLYTYSLADNLRPKWDFYSCMGRSKSELVRFPQYFGYSLEERIKPRQKRLEQYGVVMSLNRMLSTTEIKFERLLERQITRMGLEMQGKQDSCNEVSNLEIGMNKMSIT